MGILPVRFRGCLRIEPHWRDARATAFAGIRPHGRLALSSGAALGYGVSATQEGYSSASTGQVIRQPAFVTTHWSAVIRAGRNDTTHARDALSRLCQTYWYPLYVYVRKRGHSPEDAKDLTQEFFSRLLARNWFGCADPQKGRFRSFLLSAMNHFLADEWDKARAQKRGGGVPAVPLQIDAAETRYCHEPADNVTPEQTYERRWAVELLAGVLNRLKDEYERDSKGALFAALNPCLVGERTAQPYARLAKSLSVTEGTVKAAVHRMRQRYRQLLREEIANTVASDDEVDEEMRHLSTVLARG